MEIKLICEHFDQIVPATARLLLSHNKFSRYVPWWNKTKIVELFAWADESRGDTKLVGFIGGNTVVAE
jgi:hypothetical protein